MVLYRQGGTQQRCLQLQTGSLYTGLKEDNGPECLVSSLRVENLDCQHASPFGVVDPKTLRWSYLDKEGPDKDAYSYKLNHCVQG
jgi:hypothetical protein